MQRTKLQINQVVDVDRTGKDLEAVDTGGSSGPHRMPKRYRDSQGYHWSLRVRKIL